jgi:hypothetical protein
MMQLCSAGASVSHYVAVSFMGVEHTCSRKRRPEIKYAHRINRSLGRGRRAASSSARSAYRAAIREGCGVRILDPLLRGDSP